MLGKEERGSLMLYASVYLTTSRGRCGCSQGQETDVDMGIFLRTGPDPEGIMLNGPDPEGIILKHTRHVFSLSQQQKKCMMGTGGSGFVVLI